jgi:adenosylcobinamide-phosphate synthase
VFFLEDLIALPIGFLLDLALGDRPDLPHPTRWIGRLVLFLEPRVRRWFQSERWAGVVFLVLVLLLVGGVSWGLLMLAGWVHPALRIALASVMVYLGVSGATLGQEAEAIAEMEVAGYKADARKRLSGIVGRDTADLDTPDLYRACVESVAENTNDGVMAPLFYGALGGPAGMWVYKAINTLDSMVGYRNEKYANFGWASARMDDVAGYLPARLTALLLSLAAIITRHDGGQALKIAWRDGRKHPSPNAGWSEAAMAGALGIQLGGPSTYQGVVSEKPPLGDPGEPLRPYHVRSAVTILRTTAWLALAVACLIGFLLLLMPWSNVSLFNRPQPQ